MNHKMKSILVFSAKSPFPTTKSPMFLTENKVFFDRVGGKLLKYGVVWMRVKGLVRWFSQYKGYGFLDKEKAIK